MAKKHQKNSFYFYIFLSIISLGMLNCNKQFATVKEKDSVTIDPGNFRPALICTDFQNLSPGTTLQKEFDFGKVKIQAEHGARIIQIPAPSDAPPWVPNQLHFIEAPCKDRGANIRILFKKPVQWVEIDLAWGKSDELSTTRSINAYFVNSNGHVSAPKEHDLGATVKTMVFTATEKIKKGGSEFGPPAEWYTAGDIDYVQINSWDCDIRLWRVCYWPSIN